MDAQLAFSVVRVSLFQLQGTKAPVIEVTVARVRFRVKMMATRARSRVKKPPVFCNKMQLCDILKPPSGNSIVEAV